MVVKVIRNRAAINLIGLALKGGNAAVGRDSVRNALHRRRAVHLFLAADAGNAVAGEMKALSEEHGVPFTVLGNKQALGGALGRMEVAVVAITDPGLAEAICEATARNGRNSGEDAAL